MEEQLNLFPETYKEQVNIFKKRYLKQKEEASKAYNLYYALLKLCPCDEKIDKETYNKNDNDKYGYSIYWDECIICGKKFNIKEECDSEY